MMMFCFYVLNFFFLGLFLYISSYIFFALHSSFIDSDSPYMFLYLSQGPIFVAFFQSYLYFSDLIRLRACTRAHWTFIISVVHIGCFALSHNLPFKMFRLKIVSVGVQPHTPHSARRQFRVYFHHTHKMCNPLWSVANKHTCHSLKEYPMPLSQPCKLCVYYYELFCDWERRMCRCDWDWALSVFQQIPKSNLLCFRHTFHEEEHPNSVLKSKTVLDSLRCENNKDRAVER